MVVMLSGCYSKELTGPMYDPTKQKKSFTQESLFIDSTQFETTFMNAPQFWRGPTFWDMNDSLITTNQLIFRTGKNNKETLIFHVTYDSTLTKISPITSGPGFIYIDQFYFPKSSRKCFQTRYNIYTNPEGGGGLPRFNHWIYRLSRQFIPDDCVNDKEVFKRIEKIYSETDTFYVFEHKISHHFTSEPRLIVLSKRDGVILKSSDAKFDGTRPVRAEFHERYPSVLAYLRENQYFGIE